MNNAAGGYTLIEAMLVLAISGILLISANTLFHGDRSNTEFSQAIAELQTQIQSYGNEVSTGLLSNGKYRCNINATSGRAAVKYVPAGVVDSSNESCVSLGKALLPVNGTDTLIAYQVLGSRLNSSGLPIASVSEAMPEPAGSPVSSDLTGVGSPLTGSGFTYAKEFSKTYNLLNGAQIVSATANGSTAGVLKVYTTLQNDNTTGRQIAAYASSITNNSSLPDSDNLKACIEESGGSPCAKQDITSAGWDLCIKNSGDSQRAKIKVKPSANGLLTSASFEPCT